MSSIEKQVWGNDTSGDPVHLYTFRNSHGTEAAITDFGGRVVRLKIADRQGQVKDVVLGFDTLDGYLVKNPFLGALVGRYANRIANGRFSLNGNTYQLAQNNGQNALHGGLKGFDKVLWESREVKPGGEPALQLQYVSKDGEEGYPGTLTTTVTYTLTEANELRIDYQASTDKDTVLNLTNHSYFDLTGSFAGHILDHQVTIQADQFTPINTNLIPTGELRNVEGTPFDFRKPMAIGSRIEADDEQLKVSHGYDHNFVLRGGSALKPAASVTEPVSGRVMDVLTTQPGMQFYSGNHLDGSAKGKGGVAYQFRYGFCFETQHFPDSPNQPQFPTTELKPGQEFKEVTVFRFSTAG